MNMMEIFMHFISSWTCRDYGYHTAVLNFHKIITNLFGGIVKCILFRIFQ